MVFAGGLSGRPHFVKERLVLVTYGIFSFGDKSLFFKLDLFPSRAGGGSFYYVSSSLLRLLD